jgi:imidazolonepropionase-like amidohydrolase
VLSALVAAAVLPVVVRAGTLLDGTGSTAASAVTTVETARMLGRRVAAHAHGTEGIKAAVRAGLASIEHGWLLDAERRRAHEAARNLAPLPRGRASRAAWPRPPGYRSRGEGFRRRPPRAQRTGVRAADALRLDAHAGHTAGTLGAARLLGREHEIGSVEMGKRADLVAVKGDPLTERGTSRPHNT